ncbi:hypothetical protein IJ732_02745 [bacterium]|nr:hypothetical protein [bacterium]
MTQSFVKQINIIFRDFNLNSEEFSNRAQTYNQQKYGYISAAQSVSTLFNLDGGIHCSEVYMKEIQTCGLFKNINPNKITPDAFTFAGKSSLQ